MRRAISWPATALLSVFALSQCGCAVPQRPGKGLCTRLVEPETRTGYWLYLPEDYVKNDGKHPNNERWPVVLTLHGLKPYDNANPQVRSWQQEADRYRFIVIAPELRTCDSLTMQFPLRDRSLPYVQKDERAILAIMDEVFRQTNADPSRVLATSFSSGGYMAHLIVNRYPERFSCLVVMGSNFGESLLDTTQLPKYRRMKIGIFFGENDFKVCREESTRAVEWYRRYRFEVEAKKVAGLGHQRRPQTAAAFFASCIGVVPKTPPELGSLVMQEVLPVEEYRPASRRRVIHRTTPRPAPRRTGAVSPGVRPRTAGGNLIYSAAPASPPAEGGKGSIEVAPTNSPLRVATPTRSWPARSQTPRRPVPRAYSVSGAPGLTGDKSDPVPSVPGRVRVHGETVGSAPMWVNLSIEMSPTLRSRASVLWIDNGRPISTGTFDAQSVLWEPGEHNIEAHVTLADSRKAVFRKTITVLARPASQPAN